MKKEKKKNELAPLRLKVSEKPQRYGDVVTLVVEGDYPKRFNEAAAIVEEAKTLMEHLRERMLPDALAEIFQTNVTNPHTPIASVALKDEEGNSTRVSFTKKYSDIPVEAVEALFKNVMVRAKGEQPAVAADINEYISRVVIPSFDGSAFLADGKFDKARYTKFAEAIQKVADELKIPNPLSVEVKVLPRQSFHNRRWVDFDKATNEAISRVVVNQINFVPCINTNGEAK